MVSRGRAVDEMRTMMGEVEQGRQISRRSVRVARVRELGLGITDFVEERMDQCLDGREALCRSVLQQA